MQIKSICVENPFFIKGINFANKEQLFRFEVK